MDSESTRIVEETTSVTVDDVEFEVKENGSGGRAVFSTTFNMSNDYKTLKFALPLISVWRDEYTGDAIKAVCRVNKPGRNEMLLEALRRNTGSMARVSAETKVLIPSGGTIIFSEKPSVTAAVTDENWQEHDVYETKTKLLYAIFDAVSSSRPVGGYRFANLNVIPDQLLTLFGFTKIEDMLGNGRAMWKARISSFIDPSESYGRGREAVKKRGNMFLVVVSAILNGDDIKEALKKSKEAEAVQ